MQSLVTAECPHCHAENQIKKTASGLGLERLRCSSCSKAWEADLDILGGSPTLSRGTLRKSDSSSEVREFIAKTKTQIEDLTKRITALLSQRMAATKFNPVSKDDVAREELQKALANPRRGFGSNPFEGDGDDADRPRFQPQESVAVVASGSASDAAGEPAVRKRSKFEPAGGIKVSANRDRRNAVRSEKNSKTEKEKITCQAT